LRFKSRLVSPLRAKSARETDWAAGLRGIAALGVLSSHLTLNFATGLVPPCDNGLDGPSRLFQRPIFRLIVQGHAWLAIFFVLMGFVNPLKPLSQAHRGNVEGALMTLAKSALNRTARVVLPASVVTVIAWLFCQFGLFELSRITGAFWIEANSPTRSESWRAAISDLVHALIDTYTKAENMYDQPQWALMWLLKGSMIIFLLLLVTVVTTTRFRLFTFMSLYCYFWLAGDGLVGINVVGGMILAEIQTLSLPPFQSRFLWLITLWTAFMGLWMMSYPSEYSFLVRWGRQMDAIGNIIFPNGCDVSRFWASLGAQLLCFSIYFNNDLRTFFSIRPFTYLGDISFSIYLLHGTLMRSVLAWSAFGPQWLAGVDPVEGKIPMPGHLHLLLVIPYFIFVTIWVSVWWTRKVEPLFQQATSIFQDIALGHSERLTSLPMTKKLSNPPNGR